MWPHPRLHQQPAQYPQPTPRCGRCVLLATPVCCGMSHSPAARPFRSGPHARPCAGHFPRRIWRPTDGPTEPFGCPPEWSRLDLWFRYWPRSQIFRCGRCADCGPRKTSDALSSMFAEPRAASLGNRRQSRPTEPQAILQGPTPQPRAPYPQPLQAPARMPDWSPHARWFRHALRRAGQHLPASAWLRSHQRTKPRMRQGP